MPRIAHVISSPHGIGGAERVLGALLSEGQQRGWEQAVLNPFATSSPNAELEALSPTAVTYRERRCHRIHEFPGMRRWLSHELERFDPSIVHAHLFHAIVAVSSLRLPNSPPQLLSHHHGDHFVNAGRSAMAAIDRLAGRRFHRVVAVSDATRRFLTDTYGYEANKVEMIHNGWSGDPQPRVPRAQGLPTVICVANLRPQKRHDVLVAAFAEVLARVPEAQLGIVGEGEMRDAIVADVSRRGLAGKVTITGTVTDVWELLARADVFAIASDYEPFGISIVEAMAAGVPVVATNVGGIPELVEDGSTGYLVPAGSQALMADRICALLQNPARSQNMGATAAKVAHNFTAQRMVDTYFELYETLIAADAAAVH